jgi:hypothetical protein
MANMNGATPHRENIDLPEWVKAIYGILEKAKCQV